MGSERDRVEAIPLDALQVPIPAAADCVSLRYQIAQKLHANAHPSIAYREIPDPAWDPKRNPLRIGRLIPHMDRLLRTPARRALDPDVGRGR